MTHCTHGGNFLQHEFGATGILCTAFQAKRDSGTRCIFVWVRVWSPSPSPCVLRVFESTASPLLTPITLQGWDLVDLRHRDCRYTTRHGTADAETSAGCREEYRKPMSTSKAIGAVEHLHRRQRLQGLYSPPYYSISLKDGRVRRCTACRMNFEIPRAQLTSLTVDLFCE